MRVNLTSTVSVMKEMECVVTKRVKIYSPHEPEYHQLHSVGLVPPVCQTSANLVSRKSHLSTDSRSD